MDAGVLVVTLPKLPAGASVRPRRTINIYQVCLGCCVWGECVGSVAPSPRVRCVLLTGNRPVAAAPPPLNPLLSPSLSLCTLPPNPK
jgi:hypothetical protein